MKRTYQFHVGPGETLARQPLVGDTLIAGFRNKRAGKVTIMVEVTYDEYDAEREEEAADTLSSYDMQAEARMKIQQFIGHKWDEAKGCAGGYAASNSGVPGGCNGGGSAQANAVVVAYGVQYPSVVREFPKSEEETFAQRYERAMRLIK